MLELQEVIKKSDQGYGDAYYCQGEDGQHYWVKGLAALRDYQANEWIAANLATLLGLPIAHFCLVNVSEELYLYLPEDFKTGIGYGPVFASQHVEGSSELIQMLLDSVPVEIKRKLLLFDYWIQNEDRTVGNPNLLWIPETERLVVIDHNLAFDESFDEVRFFGDGNDGHIFRSVKEDLFSDLVVIAEQKQKLQNALQHFQRIVDEIPVEWRFSDLEKNYAADVDYEGKRLILERCLRDDFWCRK